MRIGVHVVLIAHITHTLGSTFLLADCDPSETQIQNRSKGRTQSQSLFEILCGGFSRKGKAVFEGVGFGFEGVGKRLEMAAEMQELIQKRVDFESINTTNEKYNPGEINTTYS